MQTRRRAAVLAGVELICCATISAQNPFRDASEAVEVRYSHGQPAVSYVLRVAPQDTTGFDVEMRIRNARDPFRIAMVMHPEYDDRYWRFVTGLRLESPTGHAAIVRLDSALWRVTGAGGEVTVRYRISLPLRTSPTRNAWRAYLTSNGGMIGGPHSFMYIVGQELAPAHVRLDVPAGWDVATGLAPTSDPHIFFAATVDVLVDSPVLVGALRNWRFDVNSVPHRIAYLPLPNAEAFDTFAFSRGIERVVRQSIALFGRAPYRDYTFMIQDGAFGGLEHANSVTIGAPSANLAKDPYALLEQTTHEYFHTWNLVRIRPVEYNGIDYRPGPVTSGIWWAEGLTLFYADLLLRRAGLPTDDSTRTAHLASSIARYLGTSGNTLLSPEHSSRLSNITGPLAQGDDNPSVHLQGELLGDMLDLIVRNATNGRRTIDDVMRLMQDRYSGRTGFTGSDIEHTVDVVCGCVSHVFFERYVRRPGTIDFNRYLALIGLRSRVRSVPATTSGGVPEPDALVDVWLPEGSPHPRLRVFDRASIWAKAGMHTGDTVVSVNGVPTTGVAAFRSRIAGVKVGDTVRIEFGRASGRTTTALVVPQIVRPVVTIEEISGGTERQRRLREAWAAGH